MPDNAAALAWLRKVHPRCAQHAGRAHGARTEVRQTLEVTRDDDPSAPLLGVRVVALGLAALALRHYPEDVLRVALEVLTVSDELVVRVDRRERSAASLEEDHVDDDASSWEEVALVRELARQAERLEHVVATQDLAAEVDVLPALSRHEAHRHDEHADAALLEQVESSPHEVGVGPLLSEVAVGIVDDVQRAVAVGRVGEHQPERALLPRVLDDPLLERSLRDVGSGHQRLEDLRGDL